jgi:hypothetical protein
MEFFKILFFSKVLLLTPNPINITNKVEISPAEPLKAITAGASLQLDVSGIFAPIKGEDIHKVNQEILEKFPSGTIHAKLITEDEKLVTLEYLGHYSYAEKNLRLILERSPGVPTNIKFNKVLIESDISLKDVKIFWKNFSE